VGCRQEYGRRRVGTELLGRAEASLREHGSTSVSAGRAGPNKPFYLGVYGGSNAAGFLHSDADAEPFLLANGYVAERRVFVFDRRLDMPLTIVDPRFGALRQRYEAQALPQARLRAWRRGCVFGPRGAR